MPKYGFQFSKIPEYRVWIGIKQRCLNKNRESYPMYGGRGIKICSRWKHSFLNFLCDVGCRPSPRHSIDRFPNPYGSYEPGNCRWATASEQRRNHRIRTKCNHGHLFTPENIYRFTKNGKTYRTCAVCKRTAHRKDYLENKERYLQRAKERYIHAR